ncbi:MAG TPA: CbiX/SirB N-terminal domain-containing protein [Methylomirabilota bacterium]|nr:CbiX/SirB N-terminal domain-containing protein [Methylomirabilota bacterium]
MQAAPDNFQDSTLVLIGHGSTLTADASLPIYQHVDELRSRGAFGQVIEAFWKQEPSIAGVLRGAYGRRVFIVPMFISEGYFTDEVVPRELGFAEPGQRDFARTQRRGLQRLYYCSPVGSHPGMTNLLLTRAEEVIKRFPFPRAPKSTETALFIAGHGTTANENSRKAIERQVELLRAKERFAEVHPIFMEEAPRIADCYTMTQQRNLVVVPFFISDGLHSYEDIPIMLGEPERLVKTRLQNGQPTWRNPTEKKGKLVWYTASIGKEPQMADVILDLVREAARAEQENVFAKWVELPAAEAPNLT